MGLRVPQRPSLTSRHLGALRGLAQTIAAQAILAIERHRQARGFFGTPAGTCQAAGEFRSAPGTGEAARGLNF
jgi:hypothetical protein